MRQFFWPSGLAVYYPYSGSPPSAVGRRRFLRLLAVISVLAWTWRRKCPYLVVGWLWYLGMMVPVIGLVQVGGQTMADRYTYLPLIGPALALVWLVADLAGLGQSPLCRERGGVAGPPGPGRVRRPPDRHLARRRHALDAGR